MFRYFWNNYIINVSVLVEKSSTVSELYTYYPFTEKHCKRALPIRINRFTSQLSQWDNNEMIFPPKINNLHACSVVAALWDTPPYLSLLTDMSGRQTIGDFEGKLLTEFSKKLNFSLKIITPLNDEQRGRIYANGTTTGAIKLV